MRGNIQFEKIDVKKQSKPKQTALVFLGALLIAVLSVVTFVSVNAYFTATSERGITFSFGTIEVALLDKNSVAYTNDSFKTAHLSNIMPGSTIDLSGIKVQNTGDFEEYVLINVDIKIPSATAQTLHYNKWFNLDGVEVKHLDFAVNSAKASLIKKASTATTNIKWKVPGEAVDHNYEGATAEVTVSAYGTQTLLPDSIAYTSKELYASYFICKNASNIATDAGLNYAGDQAVGEPLRKIDGKNILDLQSLPRAEFCPTSITINSSNSATVTAVNPTPYYYVRYDITHLLQVGKTYTVSSTFDNSTYGGCVFDEFDIDGARTAGSARTITVKTGYAYKLKLYANTTGTAITDGSTMTINYTNIQIEEGSSITTYQDYSSVKDTFDISTQTLTRNIGKIEFTGDENWVETAIEGQNFTTRYTVVPLDSNLKIASIDQFSYNSHFENVGYNDDEEGYLGTSDNTNYSIKSNIDNLTEFKAWLKAEYDAGHPVTVWYQLATPTTEKVFTSKNLYEGEQYLHFETGATDNNFNQSGTILMSDGATQNLANFELGDNMFEYAKSKPFTVSFKLKRHADDVKTMPRVSVSYQQNSENVLATYKKYSEAIPANGEWAYYWISVPALTSVENYQNAKLIKLQISDYSSPTNVHFEIHNLQIEIGSVPTDFDNYDATEYARVNGVALRQLGDNVDTYNASTKTISRNVLKLEFNGTETGWTAWESSATENSIGIFYRDSQIFGVYQNATFLKTPAICSHFEYTGNSLATQNDDRVELFAVSATSNPPHVGFKLPFTTLDACKEWVQEQYENGKPLTVWLRRSTAVNEALS